MAIKPDKNLLAPLRPSGIIANRFSPFIAAVKCLTEIMSYEHTIEIVENDVLVVSLIEGDGCYFMWQKGLTNEVGSEDGIYFEFDDQLNGRHDQVKECKVTNDGVHVVLANGDLKHCHFPPGFDKLEELKDGLNNIYSEQVGIIEFSI